MCVYNVLDRGQVDSWNVSIKYRQNEVVSGVPGRDNGGGENVGFCVGNNTDVSRHQQNLGAATIPKN